jgi:hypothetical protein
MPKSILQDRISKHELQKLYTEEKLTQPEIALRYNISPASIQRLMKIYGIVARSFSEVATNKIIEYGDGLKKCTFCEDIKNRNEFNAHSDTRDGLYSQCRECQKRNSLPCRIKRKQRILSKEQEQKERLSALFYNVKSRAKVREVPFTISSEWIMDQFTKQNGCCLLTGLELDCSATSTRNAYRNAFSPSLDQIVPGAGYTETNARLVCTAINLGMNEFGLDTFRLVAKALFSHEKAKEKEENSQSSCVASKTEESWPS